MRQKSNSNILGLLASLLLSFALAPGAFALAGQKVPAAPQENNSSEIDKQLHAAQDALDRKDFGAAAKLLEAVVKVQPEFGAAWFNLAYAYTALGRKDDAIAAYGKVLKLNPDMAQAHMNLGILLLESKRPSDAADHFAEAVELDATNARNHLYYARALVQTGERDEAAKQFQETLRLDPKSAIAAFDLGQLYFDEKRFEDAHKFFGAAAELDP
ncbi:MAG: tetratricopeptide repeat protein, partial [Deltaproteobacteria bacterium]